MAYDVESLALFLLGIAVGLFELYLFGNHDKGLLVPVAILGESEGPLCKEFYQF